MTPVRLLYVDDDTALGLLTSRRLGRDGFTVTHAPSGAAGLSLLATETFDAVLLDHVMPEMDGLQTLAAIHALPDPPPVIYATGTDEGRVAVAALKAGAADYIIKAPGDAYFELLASAARAAVDARAVEAARAEAEAQANAARERAELLLREVNHRVANSLQLVSSFVSMQAMAVTDPAAQAALGETQARIRAVAGVHRRLYASGDARFVSLDDYLAGVIEELRHSLADDGRHALTLAADAVPMAPDRAVSVGIIVTELVTNACKYAYPDGAGAVRTSLTRLNGAARLTVEDDGVGWTRGGAAKGTGLGSRILDAMARSLKSELVFADGPGTRVAMEFAV